jgi:hypothetical protein
MSNYRPDLFFSDPGNWKLGFIYFCPQDPRILVPKRVHWLGWTINFARPLALPFLGWLIALVLGLRELVRPGGDVPLSVTVLACLGGIAWIYRRAHRHGKRPEHSY